MKIESVKERRGQQRIRNEAIRVLKGRTNSMEFYERVDVYVLVD